MQDKHEIGVYYFPNYHVDPRNEAAHGVGWTEWELVKRAEPRFPGHRQPKIPLWGHEDEADPAVFSRKIDAAADHGINHFIFDWYHYEDGPFLGRCLDEGYLGAPNNHRLKFCLMWANHTWTDIHPAKAHQIDRALYPGEVGPEAFDAIGGMIVERYFTHPSYWKIDGCPYFSIYDLTSLIRGLGGLKETRRALDQLRAKAVSAGLPGLNLNAVIWGQAILPGEEIIREPAMIARELGLDSFTSYVWIHHAWPRSFPVSEYQQVEDDYFAYCETAQQAIGLPYHPNVSMGWDSSPRTCQSDMWENLGNTFGPTLVGNTPAAFKKALERAKAYLEKRADHRILNINSWNEWTEGSYIEPDTEHGMAYLEAIREVFGESGRGG